jgi:hypothetical protein
LDLRDRSEEIVRNRREQVGEPGEGELRLRLGRTRDEYGHVALAREADALLPNGRLPDSRLADDRERRETAVGAVEKRLDLGELGLPPDDARHAEDATSTAVLE